MESNGCEILFWNWEVKAAGVICRWEPKVKSSFIFGKNLDDVLKAHLQGQGLKEITEIEP